MTEPTEQAGGAPNAWSAGIRPKLHAIKAGASGHHDHIETIRASCEDIVSILDGLETITKERRIDALPTVADVRQSVADFYGAMEQLELKDGATLATIQRVLAQTIRDGDREALGETLDTHQTQAEIQGITGDVAKLQTVFSVLTSSANKIAGNSNALASEIIDYQKSSTYNTLSDEDKNGMTHARDQLLINSRKLTAANFALIEQLNASESMWHR